MIIYARSPYLIEINEPSQTSSKVELFLWNTPNTLPVSATYTLSKNVASDAQRANIFNVSPYLREYINNINPVLVSAPASESNTSFVNYKIATFSNNTNRTLSFKNRVLADSGTYEADDCLGEFMGDYTFGAAVDGYTNYIGGYNQTNPLNNYCLLADNTKEIQYNLGSIPYVNVLINNALGDKLDVEYKDLNNTNVITTSVFGTSVSAGKYLYKIPLSTSSANYNNGNKTTLKYYVADTLAYSSLFTVIPICENKYTPVQCAFINRFGGWQFLTFFKAQTNQLTVSSTMYNLLPNNFNYNAYKGQSKAFNFNGRQTVTLNTGFVPQNYSDLIQDLMLSEVVLLDNKPVTLKTNQTNLKTTIQDKNINYTIDFEYAYNLLNNVI
jgi:hypothetical protein